MRFLVLQRASVSSTQPLAGFHPHHLSTRVVEVYGPRAACVGLGESSENQNPRLVVDDGLTRVTSWKSKMQPETLPFPLGELQYLSSDVPVLKGCPGDAMDGR